jgi:3-hydroxyisobutyrate dehydrogenase
MRIGFIGLGNMGLPMASNLVKAGHHLVVFDVVETMVQALVAQHPTQVSAAPSIKSLAQGGDSSSQTNQAFDVIISMVPEPQHVRSVYLGDAGVLANLVAPCLLIDASTIDPQTAREVAQAAHEKGYSMVDAPVSGGTGGAQAGTLTFMVGGDEAAFEQAKPVLQAMGKNIVYCGGSGNGQVAKVANNMLLAISMIGTAEAMSLGVSLGMDPKVLAGIINTSSGRCWSSDVYNPYPGVIDTAPSARGYTGGFGADLMLKDVGLATAAAKSVKQAVPMGALAQQLYQTFSNQGHGGLDFSAIIQMLSKSK